MSAMTDQDKLIRFLFLNLAYFLKQSREVIKYEDPQYSSANTGFAITMFRVEYKAYDYATECFRLLGKEPVRECGVTMSVSFDGSSGLSVLLANPRYSKDSGIECVLLYGLRTLIMAFSLFPPFEKGKGEAKHDNNHAN